MAFVDERGNNGEDGLGRGHLVLAGDPHKFIDLNAIKMVPLKSERRCIRLGRDETENVPDVENSSGQPAHTRLPSAISPFSASPKSQKQSRSRRTIEAQKHLLFPSTHASFLSFLAYQSRLQFRRVWRKRNVADPGGSAQLVPEQAARRPAQLNQQEMRHGRRRITHVHWHPGVRTWERNYKVAGTKPPRRAASLQSDLLTRDMGATSKNTYSSSTYLIISFVLTPFIHRRRMFCTILGSPAP
jgi:hypothetical protein